MKKETILQNKIRVALCKEGCIVHRCNSGLYYASDGSPVRCGEVGHTDLYGHRWDGKAFYLEVKTPVGRASREQKQFVSAMKATGAIAGFVRTEEEAISMISAGGM